jgi:hypothetical protein
MSDFTMGGVYGIVLVLTLATIAYTVAVARKRP